MTATKTAAPVGARRRGLPMPVLGAVLFIALCLVRFVLDEPDITSVGTITAALGLAVPIALAGLGALWSERSGVVNIAMEGLMALGTWFGAYVAWKVGNSWIGLLGAVAAGVLGAALHALATVNFGVNHIVSGTAINIFSPALAAYLSVELYEGVPGAGAKQSPPIEQLPRVTVPGVSDWMADLNEKGWPIISDLAGVVGGLTTKVSLITLLTVGLFVVSWYILWRMAIGLRIRACGENPHAADSLGVDVYRVKWIAVLVSGAMAGVAGMALVDQTTKFVANQTAGKGFIGIAAMIFGNWMPGGTAAGAGLFGYADALQLRANSAVVALLLFVAIVCLVFAVNSALKGSMVTAGVLVVIAIALGVLWAGTDTISPQFVAMTPYILTLVVLTASAQNLRMPAADGVIYKR